MGGDRRSGLRCPDRQTRRSRNHGRRRRACGCSRRGRRLDRRRRRARGGVHPRPPAAGGPRRRGARGAGAGGARGGRVGSNAGRTEPMEPAEFGELAKWRYEPPYDFYDDDGESRNTPERYFAARDDDGVLLGFYYFEEKADALDYGLGLRPD